MNQFTVGSLFSGIPSEASILGSSGLDSEPSGSASPTSSVDASSHSTGPACRVIPTFDGSLWPTPQSSLGDDSCRTMPSAATAALRYEQGKRNLDDAIALSESTSSSAVSPAKTSATPASALVWAGIDPDCGLSSTDVLASFDRASSAWKTSQGSLFAASTPFSAAWPHEGTTRNGQLYAHPMLARPTAGPAFSSSPTWLTPTLRPEATTNNGSNAGRPATGKSLGKQARGDWPTPVKEDSESRTAHGTLTDKVRDRWPTPTVMDAAGFEGAPDVGRTGPNSGRTLFGAVQDWPTPQTTDANSAGRHTTQTGVMHPGTTLTDAVRAPGSATLTPQSRDHKGVSQKIAKGSYAGGLPDQLAGLHDQENSSTTGNRPASSPRPVLNPRWVATLMGFPADWLDGVAPVSRRSATRSSRTLRKSSRGAVENSLPERRDE